ncbi:MAG: hypothetical protein AABW83_02835 [Nanoarchaeota archaeon]
MVDLNDEVRDLNFISEGELFEIMHVGKHYTLPYMCILRHQDKRVFELVKSPIDEDITSRRLILNQSRKDPKSNFSRFKIIPSAERNYEDWHYNSFNRYIVIESHFL